MKALPAGPFATLVTLPNTLLTTFFVRDRRLAGRAFTDVGTLRPAFTLSRRSVGREYDSISESLKPFCAYLATNDAGRIPWKISSTKSCSMSNPAPMMPIACLSPANTWIMYC